MAGGVIPSAGLELMGAGVTVATHGLNKTHLTGSVGMWSEDGPQGLFASTEVDVVYRAAVGAYCNCTIYKDDGGSLFARSIGDTELWMGDPGNLGYNYRAALAFNSPGISGVVLSAKLRLVTPVARQGGTGTWRVQVFAGDAVSLGYGVYPLTSHWSAMEGGTFAGLFNYKNPATTMTLNLNLAGREAIRDIIAAGQEIHVAVMKDDSVEAADTFYYAYSSDFAGGDTGRPKLLLEIAEPVGGFPGKPCRTGLELMSR